MPSTAPNVGDTVYANQPRSGPGFRTPGGGMTMFQLPGNSQESEMKTYLEDQMGSLINNIVNINKWTRNAKGELVNKDGDKVTDLEFFKEMADQTGATLERDNFNAAGKLTNSFLTDSVGSSVIQHATEPLDVFQQFSRVISHAVTAPVNSVEDMIVTAKQDPALAANNVFADMTGINFMDRSFDPMTFGANFLGPIGAIINWGLHQAGVDATIGGGNLDKTADGNTDTSKPKPDETAKPTDSGDGSPGGTPGGYTPVPNINPDGSIDTIVVTGPRGNFGVTWQDLTNAGLDFRDLFQFESTGLFPGFDINQQGGQNAGTPGGVTQTGPGGGDKPPEEVVVIGKRPTNPIGDSLPIEGGFGLGGTTPVDNPAPNINVGGGGQGTNNNTTPIPIEGGPVNTNNPPGGAGGTGQGGGGGGAVSPPPPPPSTTGGFQYFAMPNFTLLSNSFGANATTVNTPQDSGAK